jgi:dCMP deaminase
MTSWDDRWISLSRFIAEWSKDRSTKVGCVIIGPENQVLSTGYNGFPRGVNDDIDERHERPDKYLWTEHAERNAIYNAARHGVALRNTTIYIPWYPCANCARAIIQAGITTVVATVPDMSYRGWGPEFEVAGIMMEESGVEVRLIDNV